MRITLSHPTLYRRATQLSLRTVRALFRSRRALGALDPTQLRDVGLTADQARTEAQKPVWDVPASWKY